MKKDTKDLLASEDEQLKKLQEIVKNESVRRRSSEEYQELLGSYNIK